MPPPVAEIRRQTLAVALASFRPVDEQEAAHQTRMLELLGAAGDPFSRRHFVPGHFTASSFVLAPDAPQILLIWHRKLERWLQPGGHVDSADPDLLSAARREVGEEVGLQQLALHPAVPGIFDLDIHLIPARADEPAHQHFDVRFLFTAPTRQVALNDEVRRAEWFNLERARAGSDASVRRALTKLERLA